MTYLDLDQYRASSYVWAQISWSPQPGQPWSPQRSESLSLSKLSSFSHEPERMGQTSGQGLRDPPPSLWDVFALSGCHHEDQESRQCCSGHFQGFVEKEKHKWKMVTVEMFTLVKDLMQKSYAQFKDVTVGLRNHSHIHLALHQSPNTSRSRRSQTQENTQYFKWRKTASYLFSVSQEGVKGPQLQDLLPRSHLVGIYTPGPLKSRPLVEMCNM